MNLRFESQLTVDKLFSQWKSGDTFRVSKNCSFRSKCPPLHNISFCMTTMAIGSLILNGSTQPRRRRSILQYLSFAYLFLMDQSRPLSLQFTFFQAFYSQKNFRGIRTWNVRVVGEHADHYTTLTTVPFFCIFVEQFRKYFLKSHGLSNPKGCLPALLLVVEKWPKQRWRLFAKQFLCLLASVLTS